ncbi:unnamed protein product, partial [Chrysoparadoxa australica]
QVFVAGGTKGVGRLIVESLTAQGSEVVAIARTSEGKEELDALPGVTGVLMDAFDLKGVEGAIDGCDACITTMGGGANEEGQLVDYAGNRNVIESAGILGVTRCVLVTSVGCGNSREAVSDEVYEQLQPVLKAKTLAENMLLKYYTNTEWTIIRPGGLMSEEATGKAILTQDTKACGVVNRADVADLAVKALNTPSTIQKILAAVDPTIDSPYSSGGPYEAFSL